MYRIQNPFTDKAAGSNFTALEIKTGGCFLKYLG